MRIAKIFVIPATAISLTFLHALAPVPASAAEVINSARTVATARIEGPVSNLDIGRGTVVMASTGEVVGKIVSTLRSDEGVEFRIIQVAGTEFDTLGKNVTVSPRHLSPTSAGNYMIDLTASQFAQVVATQN